MCVSSRVSWKRTAWSYRVSFDWIGFLFFNRPTLQFSESTVSDISPPESISLSREESYLGLEPLYFNSISRSSSERSGTGAKDILVSPLGEATEFLPIKVIAPEMHADIQELLTPIFEDYHRVMVRNEKRLLIFIVCLKSLDDTRQGYQTLREEKFFVSPISEGLLKAI